MPRPRALQDRQAIPQLSRSAAIRTTALMALTALAATVPCVAAVSAAAASPTWTPVGPAVSTQAVAVGAPQLQPAQPGTLYAAITGQSAIFTSSDEGASWRSTHQIFLNSPFGCCAQPVVADTFKLYADPALPGVAYVLANSAEVPFQNTLYGTTDSGVSWTGQDSGEIQLVFTAVPGQYWELASDFVERLGDGSQSVFIPQPANLTALAVDPAQPEAIYLADLGSHLIYSSPDGGTTRKALPPLPDNNAQVIQLVLDGSTAPATLLALVHPTESSFGAALWIAQPGGPSGATVWTTPASLPEGLVATQIGLDPHETGTVYISSLSGFYVSHDHGATWTSESAGLPSNQVFAFAIDPTLNGPLWAATGKGLARFDRGGCKAGPGLPNACLGGTRFQTQIGYTLDGQTATATPVQLSDDTAAFWFTNPASYEVLVKVLDGTAVNGDFWVFSGGLSNVEYMVTVTDIVTGAVRTYPKSAGTLQSFADTSAFAGSGPQIGRSAAVRGKPQAVVAAAEHQTAGEPLSAGGVAKPPRPAAARPCSPDVTDLCLASRFQVAVIWSGGALSGAGQALPLTDDTGSFWFLAADNYELTVKILDGTAVNGHFWVFYGAMTDFDYTISIADAITGNVRTYHNPAGTIASFADTSAF